MRIALEPASARWFFLCLVLLITGGLVLPSGKAWLAAEWSRSSNLERREEAAELEPGNAAYWLRLGVYHQQNLLRPDPRRALLEFRRAARANPDSDETWLHIAGLSEDLGDIVAARSAYQQAQACHPISAEVAWRYGSFLIRQEDFPAAYLQLCRAIREDPALTPAAITQFSEAGRGAAEILDGLLSARTDAYFTALNFFLAQHDAADGLVVWGRLLALRQPWAMQQAVPLVDELLREGQVEAAQRTWREGLRATGRDSEAAGGSLIFDGTFEQDPLNGGFDWQEVPVPGVRYARDRGVSRAGAPSLRVQFDGSANLDFAQLLQFVAVQPRQRYRFSAFLRTEEITTESGVGFEIEDARTPRALNVFTPALTGTHPWTETAADFETGAQTRLLLVSLRRKQSTRLDNKLRGTVWLDEVALVPVENGGDARP